MPCQTVTVEGESSGGADIVVKSVTAPDNNPAPGETAIASIVIANNGSEGGDSNILVTMNGYKAATITQHVAAGEETTYEMEFGVPDADTVTISAGGKSDTFTTGGGSGGTGDIVVVSVNGPSTEPSPGDTVEVSVLVENTGSSGATSDIPVSVNGATYTTINKFIGGGEDVSIGVNIQVPDAEMVTVTAGGESTNFATSGGDGGDGGGEEPSGNDIVQSIIGFAKDNPYVVGAGAVAVGYMATKGGGRTVIPRYASPGPRQRSTQTRSGGSANNTRDNTGGER